MASEAGSAEPKISFGFSKKISNKKVENSVVGGEEPQANRVTDFVFSLEGKEINSSIKTEEKTEYVIPLKKTRKEPPTNKFKSETPELAEGVDSEAIREIIADAARQNEEWEEDGTHHGNATIPLLMKKKLEEEEGSDREVEEADYEEIPLEHFGMAMIKGMGWKEGEGVGKKGKNIAPIEATLRPKGLGLGADRGQATKLNESKITSNNSKDKEDELLLKKGSHCVVLKGAHADLYGVIEGIDEDNARVFVKLSLNSQTVTLSQYGVKLVSKKEFEKYSKYINKGKVDKYKKEKEIEDNREKEKREERTHKHNKNDSSRSHKHKDHGDSGKDPSGKRRKIDEDQADRLSEKSSKKSNGYNEKSEDILWVRRDIRVRFIDKQYKKGKYYNTKVTVEDVFDRENCMCKTENGKLLENVSQSMLETLIPKSEPGYVVIVCGKYRKQIAQIVKKDKRNCIATLQLLQDRDKVLKLDYDSICEYIGDVEAEFFY